MGTCYNILYNTSTSAFYKHNTSVTATGEHDCGYYVENDPTINALLNTSADSIYGVTSANTDLADVLVESETQTSGSPDISASNINEVNAMKVQIVIKAISVVIKTGYLPLAKVKPTDVVTR